MLLLFDDVVEPPGKMAVDGVLFIVTLLVKTGIVRVGSVARYFKHLLSDGTAVVVLREDCLLGLSGVAWRVLLDLGDKRRKMDTVLTSPYFVGVELDCLFDF